MDEIFDYIKNTKIPRKYLVSWLISSEILGILVLIWFLRVPLSQKFLITPPKAYSVVSMSPQKRYLLSQGDLLTGKAIPNTNLKILITPGFLKTSVTADSKGDFWYQVPKDLQKTIHRITFGNFDKKNKLVTFQTYKFRVQSNISIFKFIDSTQKKLGLSFGLEKVQAQGNFSLSSNYYANLGLPAPNNPVELTEDEKYRLKNYFLPYAYPASQIFGVDLGLMGMWIFSEDYISNYMDNCLDGNKTFGEDADLNQNTPCTGWVNHQRGTAPNWQVGWGIFPWQTIDKLSEAIAVTRPGESIQEIGQRVIEESKEVDRYTQRGLIFFKPPNDPITNPEIFPSDVTLDQIIEGAKPLGDDKDRSKTCRPEDRTHADPLQDPKDCQMRQLLGILMKDPAISAYLLAFTWKEILDQGSLTSTIRTWGPPNKNPYLDFQKDSNILAAINDAMADVDLEATSTKPKITITSAIASQAIQDPVYPIDGVQVESVVSSQGYAWSDDEIKTYLQKRYLLIPAGTSPQDFLCNDPEKCEKNPTPQNNVKGISTINSININAEVLANPANYQLCALLEPVDFDVVIDADCVPLDQVIDPQIPVDSTTSEPVTVSSCPIYPEAGEFFCAEGVCRSTEYDCSSGRRWYFDEYKNTQNSCEFEAKSNTGREFAGLWYHGDIDPSCSEEPVQEPAAEFQTYDIPASYDPDRPEIEPSQIEQEQPEPEKIDIDQTIELEGN